MQTIHVRLHDTRGHRCRFFDRATKFQSSRPPPPPPSLVDFRAPEFSRTSVWLSPPPSPPCPRESSRSCSPARVYITRRRKNMCERCDLGPTRPLARTKGSRPPWLVGLLWTNRCLGIVHVIAHARTLPRNLAAKFSYRGRTSSRTLHWRPCRAIDRCARPLDLSSFVATAYRIPNESTFLSFRAFQKRSTSLCFSNFSILLRLMVRKNDCSFFFEADKELQ